MDQQSLDRTVADLIGRRGEGVYWDFKFKHHTKTNKWKLIHDVLCLANAEHDGPRFLVFGVNDVDFSVHSIEKDSGRRTQADIAGLFSGNARKFFQSRFPTFHLREIEIHGKLVDVLVIEDEPKKPYYLVEHVGDLRAHHIYTRVCDTNTAIDAAAQPHEIERMWRERFGLDEPAFKRAKRLLAEPAAWWISESEVDRFVCCYHHAFPEFTLKAASAESHVACNEEWTRGEVRTDDNFAGWYELRYHQTVLRRVRYVGFDNRKKDMVAPDYEQIGKGRFYFYKADSLEYAIQRFWTTRNGGDDSKGLRIRGDGEAARDARARWGGRLDIPVLKPDELDGFLTGRRWDAIRGPDPETDRCEQYELFLRNLLDFDDWWRAR